MSVRVAQIRSTVHPGAAPDSLVAKCRFARVGRPGPPWLQGFAVKLRRWVCYPSVPEVVPRRHPPIDITWEFTPLANRAFHLKSHQ